MKRQAKWFLIPCAAMALTLGSALVSFAATGWAEENGEWVYYNNDGKPPMYSRNPATTGSIWIPTETWLKTS